MHDSATSEFCVKASWSSIPPSKANLTFGEKFSLSLQINHFSMQGSSNYCARWKFLFLTFALKATCNLGLSLAVITIDKIIVLIDL